MMNVRGVQRNLKNVVKNYSDAQVKVREATSNDPWGPPSTLMAEIADLTYNVVAFSEIMQMIWKRLNDHGKNWRHVYKALVLLEYLIKTGSDKVAQQCKENIFAIQTLKDFQYLEENKDQGMNVREKSKMLVALLKDEERLKSERSRALKAKERFAQSMSYASDPQTTDLPKTSMSYHESISGLTSGDQGKPLPSDLENARPQTIGEEELQLQLALAMSKEEAEAEEKVRKNDDLRLQLALSESQKQRLEATKRSAVEDLLSLNTGMASDPWGAPSNGTSSSLGAVGGAVGGAIGGMSSMVSSSLEDPWATKPVTNSDPWNPQGARSSSATNDPWQPSPPPNSNPAPQTDPWSPMDAMLSSSTSQGDILGNGTRLNSTRSPETTSALTRKTPESFLGPNSNLVNLDALVSTKTSTGIGGNPFAGSVVGSASLANPFQAAKPAAPTINQLRSQGSFPVSSSGSTAVNNQMNFDGLTPSVIGTNLSSSSNPSNPFSL